MPPIVAGLAPEAHRDFTAATFMILSHLSSRAPLRDKLLSCESVFAVFQQWHVIMLMGVGGGDVILGDVGSGKGCLVDWRDVVGGCCCNGMILSHLSSSNGIHL